jgi:RNA polymerase primary sigma factor
VHVRALALVLLGTMLTRDDVRRARARRDITPLLARARRGDRRAREELVRMHMGLIRAVANRYRGLGLPFEDLVQEGSIGLLAAIDGFRAGRGAAFSTYAHLRIRNAITRALTEHGRVLRLPKPVVERRHALAQAEQRLSGDGSHPTADVLARATGMRREDVVDALGAPGRVASLDAALPDGTSLESIVSDPRATDPEAHVLARERREFVKRAMRALTPRQQYVLRSYYGVGQEPESLGAIGAHLDVSAQRAGAIKNDALSDLARELEPALGSGAGSS